MVPKKCGRAVAAFNGSVSSIPGRLSPRLQRCRSWKVSPGSVRRAALRGRQGYQRKKRKTAESAFEESTQFAGRRTLKSPTDPSQRSCETWSHAEQDVATIQSPQRTGRKCSIATRARTSPMTSKQRHPMSNCNESQRSCQNEVVAD